eukprot:TRINITY_DN1014_c0_g1_i1.p1 TRINITY_DN1014_c0_g1~~TRINITY_DN1014_c0_g1_i1.p1  ORF type:complete len:1806 (+),score=251.50 TRINITY_DN1014_c0_g1_i1:3065-8482(+)
MLNSPIRSEEKIKLTSVGIPADVYKQANLSLESDRFICIKEATPDGTIMFNIVDINQGFKVQKKPIKADSVMMHPSKPIISMRTGGDQPSSGIQVVDLTRKEVLRELNIPEQVQLWRWVSDTVIGVVGTKSIYHIDITTKPSTSPATMVFKKSEDIEKVQAQILNYAVDSTGKWCVLYGIYQSNGALNGMIQLYSTEQQASQSLEGFAPCFADVPLIDPNYKNTIITFVGKKATESAWNFLVLEVGKPIEPSQKIKKKQPFQSAPEVTTADIPILSYISEKYALGFIVSRLGYLYVHELYTGSMIYRMRLSPDMVVASCRHSQTDGMMCVNRKGVVFLVTVDEKNIVNYIQTQCPHIPDAVGVAFKIARAGSLPGAEQLFMDLFNKYIAERDYTKAAKTAAEAPNGMLRTAETINKFKASPAVPGGKGQPLLQYFSYLLEANIKLNAIETMELVKPVLIQGRKDLVESWVKGDKVECTIELGELVRPYDRALAATIFNKAGSAEMTVQLMVEAGQFDQIKAYCSRTGHQPNFLKILKSVLDSGLPERAVELGKMVCNRGEGGKGTPAVPLATVFDLFLQYNRVAELTQIMVDALECNKPEDGPLQTKLLELCLSRDPNLAVSILQRHQLTYYDKPKIGRLCEQIGLLGYALENYTELSDIRRVIVNTHMLNKEQLISFLCTLDAEKAQTCLADMIRTSPHNVAVAAEAAVKLSESGAIPQEDIIKTFESLGSIDGMFMYLRQIIATSEDQDIYFKYIEAATKLNHLTEVERVIRETQYYDPEKVKNFLMEMRLENPKALIYLCDAHGYIEEMTKYLYKNNFVNYIGVYLVKVNPQAAPKVMAALLDMECEESMIKQYLTNIRMCPLGELVEAFEKRNRLRMLQGWLEARAAEGNQSTELHTALAKIYVDTNRDADAFLINNAFYDPKVVGKYCEEREPLKAYLAYKKGAGKCDMELIEVTNKNMLHKLQASYLVERQDPELWAAVLSEENPHRKRLVEQVVQTALPDTKNPEEVSVTVKAFADAGLHHELIEILDKIVLHRSDFAQYNNLKSLLILTAIKAEPTRVMDYVNRLENYNAPKLAQKAIEHELFEEAFAMYTKVNNNDEAMEVLLTKIQDLSRAQMFAEKIGHPALWSRLGQAYLMADQVGEAIQCFIKSGDPKSFMLVIGSAERQGKFDDLIDFLFMARQKLKDSQIDGALIYAYAKSQRLTDLENFLSQPNSANVEQVGDRCYSEGLYEAARMMYTQIGKLGKLASCLVNLGQYQAAIDAAKKAESPKTWEEVNSACVKAKQFHLAAVAGLKIMVHPDRLEVLVNTYEKYGYWEELIKLLDSGLALEQAHNGIFTELGILLAKYVPSRLMDHLRTYFQRLHITKVLRACEEYQMWKEAVFLHFHYGQSDSAVNIMIEHSPTAWEHDTFVQNIQKVANSDLFYKSIKFYLSEQPMLLNELLTSIANKLDLTKTVALLNQTGATALAQPFLKSVQTYNVQAVNEALNEVYLESDDFDALRASVTEYDRFDQVALAAKLEKHDLLEFRRIAALLYKKNKKYAESMALSKKDEQYKDAIDTAMESKNGDIAENLLRYFVSIGDKECFAACLYTCYELIEPDVVVELAWRNGLMEFAFPFFIQSLRELRGDVLSLRKKVDSIQKKAEKKAGEQANLGAPDYMMQQYPQIMPPPDPMAGFPGMPGGVPGGVPGGMSGGMSGGMPSGMSGMFMPMGSQFPMGKQQPTNPHSFYFTLISFESIIYLIERVRVENVLLIRIVKKEFQLKYYYAKEMKCMGCKAAWDTKVHNPRQPNSACSLQQNT